MKGKNILKEGKGFKDRRAKSGNDVMPNDNNIPIKEAKYRIVYNKNYIATFTYLDGPYKNRTATYDGQNKEWSGVEVPQGSKDSIERYYSNLSINHN